MGPENGPRGSRCWKLVGCFKFNHTNLLISHCLLTVNKSVRFFKFRYIASEEHSNFCIVLATGLSGLYSSLPRKLSPILGASPDQWCHLTKVRLVSQPLIQFGKS